MVYEPEILVHKSMSSRLRKGETRKNKTLQQIIRIKKKKKKKTKKKKKKKKKGNVFQKETLQAGFFAGANRLCSALI